MSESPTNQQFLGLIFSLHSSAWIHLGKVQNPATGKAERNLDAAREMIDLLGALEEKTRGNRTEDEEKMMAQLLNELRMNYVDELERSKSEPDATASEAATATGTGDGAAESQKATETPSESADAASQSKGESSTP